MAIAALLARTGQNTLGIRRFEVRRRAVTARRARPPPRHGYHMGSTSKDPRPGTTPSDAPARRCTSGTISHPSMTPRVPRLRIDDTTVRPSRRATPSRPSPRHRRSSGGRRTSRCSSATPPVVLVSARATALTRSTHPRGTMPTRIGSALHASIIRRSPAPADKSVTSCPQTGRQLRFLAAGKAADVRDVAHHHERRRQRREHERDRVVASGLTPSPAPNDRRPRRPSVSPPTWSWLRMSAPGPAGGRPSRSRGDTMTSAPDGGGDRLPAAKPREDRPRVSDARGEPGAGLRWSGRHRGVARPDRGRAFGDVETEREGARPAPTVRSHVGRAHVAAPEVADVEAADGLPDDQAERAPTRSDTRRCSSPRQRRCHPYAVEFSPARRLGPAPRRPGDGRSSKVAPPPHAAVHRGRRTRPAAARDQRDDSPAEPGADHPRPGAPVDGLGGARPPRRAPRC